MTHNRWVVDVVIALTNLGGEGSYRQIYQEIARIRRGSLSNSWHATVRHTIERHSSDSDNYVASLPDLFYAPRGKGEGFWRIRNFERLVTGEPLARQVPGSDKAENQPPRPVQEVRCPHDLDRPTRARVRAQLEFLANTFDEEAFKKVKRLIKRKTEILACSKVRWVRNLGLQMEALYHLFRAALAGSVRIGEELVRYIGATLQYFVESADIIPDYQPGMGYVDDALALALCLKQIHSVQPSLVELYGN